MKVPFRVGEIVFDENFTNRADEVVRIRRALEGAERLLVYGERRQGKSSAIRQASLPVERAGGVVVRVDLWTLRSMAELARRLVAGLPWSWAPRERFSLFLAQLGLEPVVKVDAYGNPGLGLGIASDRMDDTRARDVLTRILSALNDIAGESGRPVAIVLDEFQQIDELTPNGGALLRGIMQETPHLGYVLAGSILSLLDEQVAPDGPLYNIARLDFGPIEPGHLARWIEDRMKGHGVRPHPGSGLRIAELAGPRTEDVVRLAKECFLRGSGRGRLALDDVDLVFSDLVLQGSTAYQSLWSELPQSQQGVVRALAAGVEHLHSVAARAEHALPTSGAVTKALRVLRRRGYVGAGAPPGLADPYFRAWVLLRAMPDGRPHAAVTRP